MVKKILVCLLMTLFIMALAGILVHKTSEPLDVATLKEETGLNYRKELIPHSRKRPGTKRNIKYIVIHNTANETSNAQNERDYLVNPKNISSTSFNLVVDEKEVIEVIPIEEVSFHAGATEGNRWGVGIELCESGDFEKTKQNAAQLVAYLMEQYDISIEGIKTHKDFSGKNCPRKMLGDWDSFINQIEEEKKLID